jgi:hypothetical protein
MRHRLRQFRMRRLTILEEAHGRVAPGSLRHQLTRDSSHSFLAQALIGFTHLFVGSIGVGAATACATQPAVHPFLPIFDPL